MTKPLTLINLAPCTLTPTPQMLRKWVSRFDLWPYLEQYTLDVQREIMAGARDCGVGLCWDGNRTDVSCRNSLQTCVIC